MRTLGNIIWVLLGGFLLSLSWCMAGLLCCITIIGIPLGKQCFKFAGLAMFPFGKEIVYPGGMGAGSLLLNILWLCFGGLPLAIESFTMGILFCITIIGIPFGKQHFKLARLALSPFGADIQKQ